MGARITELRALFASLALVLLAVLGGIPDPAPVPAAPSSFTAIEVADALATSAGQLRYDDPRLAPTGGFVIPDLSLAPATPGLVTLWKITEHRPARFMKTIDIRVRWSRPGPDGQIVLSTVKAS